MMNGRSFEDRVRAFSALYPIPIIFSALLAFAMCCLSLAVVVVGPFRWILAAIGLVAALSGMALVGYVVVFRSDLLRVERETITVRWVHRA
jgi:ABC-type Na+ efflux pump permease subunit